MPISEERKAELMKRFTAVQPAAPVVLTQQDKDAQVRDVFDAPQASTGLTEERKAGLLARYGKKPASQAPEQVGVGEDMLKSIGGGIVRGAIATPMVVGNILNEAAAGPQLLGRGIADMVRPLTGLAEQPKTEPKLWKPFYSSEEVAQMLPESLRPYNPKTGYGVAADIVGQLGGGVASGAAIMKAPQTINAAANSKIMTDQSSGGIGSEARLANKVAKNEIKANKPVELYKDMLNNFKQVDDVNRANFDNLSAISSKTEMVDVKPLQAGVKSIIKELEDSPASPERANLTFFKRVQETIDKGEKLPVSDVVDLQKFLNSRYNPKKVGSAEKLSEADLFNQTKSLLDNYGAKNPAWNDAYKQAQGFFQNEVAPLKSDFVTKRGFDVNDAKIIERFNRGELKQLPDDLIERARKLPSKVNDDVAYNRLAPLVSPDKQKEFGKLVMEGANPEGSKAANPITRLGRTAAYGVGAFTSGSPYMRSRFTAEVAGMVKGQDPLYPLIKRGVQPIGERIAPDMTKAQRLAETIANQPTAGRLALPYYPKGYSPAETPAKFQQSLVNKWEDAMVPSKLGQERAAFEAQQKMVSDMARAQQDEAIMAAQEALAGRQAGVDPQTYVKFLEQQTPPVVPQAPVAPQPSVYYNPAEIASKARNEARGRGQPMNNTALQDELVKALIELQKRKK